MAETHTYTPVHADLTLSRYIKLGGHMESIWVFKYCMPVELSKWKVDHVKDRGTKTLVFPVHHFVFLVTTIWKLKQFYLRWSEEVRGKAYELNSPRSAVTLTETKLLGWTESPAYPSDFNLTRAVLCRYRQGRFNTSLRYWTIFGIVYKSLILILMVLIQKICGFSSD